MAKTIHPLQAFLAGSRAWLIPSRDDCAACQPPTTQPLETSNAAAANITQSSALHSATMALCLQTLWHQIKTTHATHSMLWLLLTLVMCLQAQLNCRHSTAGLCTSVGTSCAQLVLLMGSTPVQRHHAFQAKLEPPSVCLCVSSLCTWPAPVTWWRWWSVQPVPLKAACQHCLGL